MASIRARLKLSYLEDGSLVLWSAAHDKTFRAVVVDCVSSSVRWVATLS